MGHDVVFKQAAPGSEDGHAAAACIGTRVYDVIWCDVIWCDVTLHDVIKKYDNVWRETNDMIL